MTKAEFEAAVDSVHIDAGIYYSIPGKCPYRLYKCHKELPNQLILGPSPLELSIEFEYLGQLHVLAPWYHAPSDAALVVRIEGKEYHPTRVVIENGQIVLF